MRESLSFFGDLFGGKRRKVPVVHAGDLPALSPKTSQDFNEAVKRIQPSLEGLIKLIRQIPNASDFEIAIIVDGKPCHIRMQDGELPKIPRALIEQHPDFEKFAKLVGETAKTPADDLVQSVEVMLRAIYKVEDVDVLGAIYSPHHSAAMKLAEILEGARKRDRALISREIAKLLEGFKY